MVHAVEDKDDFDAQLEAAGDKLVVVDFHATWCGPCKQIGPYFEELSTQFTDVVFLKVDCDDCEEVAAMYEVTSIPRFVFLKGKNKVGDMIGSKQENLLKLINDLK